MGQKVNPHGLRVGVIKDWDAKWYANKEDYSELLHEDIEIRKHIKEKMFEEAFEQVLTKKSLFTLDTYYKDLSAKFPEGYFKAYRELLIPFTDIRMGRSHYKNIVSYLNRMKRIKGFEKEFNELVNLLKTKYAKRPAFLDEMKYI